MADSTSPDRPTEPSGFFAPGGGKRGAMIPAGEAMAQAHAAMRRPTPERTARGRIEAAPQRRKAERPIGPTPERLAKGDIPAAATAGGFHRSVAPIERLYKQKKLGETAEHVRDNLALFQAAERLKHHFDRKNAMGVRAQDLTRVTGGSPNGTAAEEAWVIHNKHFETAMVLMRYSAASPNRGAARIVIAVVCEEMIVTDAAVSFLLPARKEVMVATAMEKVREGLWCLATHWGFL